MCIFYFQFCLAHSDQRMSISLQVTMTSRLMFHIRAISDERCSSDLSTCECHSSQGEDTQRAQRRLYALGTSDFGCYAGMAPCKGQMAQSESVALTTAICVSEGALGNSATSVEPEGSAWWDCFLTCVLTEGLSFVISKSLHMFVTLSWCMCIYCIQKAR